MTRQAPPRPYALQVLEHGTWAVWSTYVSEANAMHRQAQLQAKGHTARVVDSSPAEPAGPPAPTSCPLCDEQHPAPYDGSCLL